MILAGLQDQPREAVERSGLADELGRDNLCPDSDTALERARVLLSERGNRK